MIKEPANVTLVRGIDEWPGVLTHVRIGLGKLRMLGRNDATMVSIEVETRLGEGRRSVIDVVETFIGRLYCHVLVKLARFNEV